MKRVSWFWGASAAALVSASSLMAQPAPPVVVPGPPPAPALPVVVPPSAPIVPVAPVQPGVSVTVGVPDSYVWDGYEYVGVVNDRYYYLGPGNVWMVMGPDRWVHFHDWERYHHDWRLHAIRNERYHYDAHGHEYPWRDGDHHRDHDWR